MVVDQIDYEGELVLRLAQGCDQTPEIRKIGGGGP